MPTCHLRFFLISGSLNGFNVYCFGDCYIISWGPLENWSFLEGAKKKTSSVPCVRRLAYHWVNCPVTQPNVTKNNKNSTCSSQLKNSAWPASLIFILFVKIPCPEFSCFEEGPWNDYEALRLWRETSFRNRGFDEVQRTLLETHCCSAFHEVKIFPLTNRDQNF